MDANFIIHAIDAKGIKESYNNAIGAEIEQFKDTKLFNIKNTTEWSEQFTSTEGLSGVRKLTENEAPDEAELDEGRSITFTPDRYGISVAFTETDYEKAKDNTIMIKDIMVEKRNAALTAMKAYLISDMFYLYNNAFSSSARTLSPDGVELCGAHLRADGTAWFTNKDTQAMDMDAVNSLEAYGGAFVDAQGNHMPLDFNTIVVKKGGAAAREAKKLFGTYGMKATQVSNVNIYEGEKTIIETPMITGTNVWFSYDSNHPIMMPLYVGINKSPTMHDPIVEKSLKVTFPVTAFWKIGIKNQPINFYGSNGTT